LANLRHAAKESVAGLPREFWWLWTSTLVNRLGAFVATFMSLYLTLDQGYSASYAGLVASALGLGGVISSLGAGVMTDRLGRRPTMLIAQSSAAVSVAVPMARRPSSWWRSSWGWQTMRPAPRCRR